MKTVKQGGAADIPQVPKATNRWDEFTNAVTTDGTLTLQRLRESDMSELTAWLRTSPPALRRLGIFDCEVGDAGAAAIADALKVNTTLTTLHLHHNKIGSDGAAALAGALKVNKTLTGFAFELNFIGDAGGVALADALEFNTSLKRLRLQANGIEDAGMAAIAKSLRGNKTLTSLFFHNKIEIEGAAALSDALKQNTTLAVLHLSNTGIDDVKAIAIADALKFNKTLTALHICNESIGDNGAMAFADALKFNKTLAKLNLSQNNFGDAAAVMLADALKSNATLAELDIKFTKIRTAGALALVEALDHNENLTTLTTEFSFNGYRDLERKLNERLQRNRDLKLKPYAEASLDLIFKHSPLIRELGVPTDVIPVLAGQLSSKVLANFTEEWRDAFRAPPPPIITTTTNTTTTTTTDSSIPAALITSAPALVPGSTSAPLVNAQPTATEADINALLADSNPVMAVFRWVDGHENPTAALNWVDPANGYTLLHYAVEAQQGAVVRSLLSRGIDSRKADYNNQTAAQLAQRRADSSSSQAVAAIAALFR